MRHVTDGELHAYLDGALGLLPGGRGKEIREHIAECPVCQERLQDEEGIRSVVERILTAPDLSEVGLPTFEELRERAEAPVPEKVGDEEAKVRYRGPLKGLPLAWAATIVLALGVGWMGSEVFRTLPRDGRLRAPVDRLESMQRSEAGIPGLTADSTSLPEALARQAEPLPDQSIHETEAASDAALSPSAVVAEGAVRDEGPVEAREQEEVPTQLEPAEIEAERRAISEAMLRETVVPPDSPSDRSLTGLAAARQLLTLEPTAQDPVPVTDSLEYSSAVPGLAVPGLKVASFEWEERVPGVKALLIRQLLSPGDTLELRYLGLLLGTETEPRRDAGVFPLEEVSGWRVYANALEASLPPGWAQVVMERERGLLVARAPSDEDQLKALLKTIR